MAHFAVQAQSSAHRTTDGTWSGTARPSFSLTEVITLSIILARAPLFASEQTRERVYDF